MDFFFEDFTKHELVGWVSTVFLTIALIPQAYSVWNTGDVSNLSLATFVLLGWGYFFLFVYGIFKQDRPTIAAGLGGLAPIVFIARRIRARDYAAIEMYHHHHKHQSSSSKRLHPRSA